LYSGFGDIGGYAHNDLRVAPPMFSHPAFDNTNTIDYAGDEPRVVVRSGMPHRGQGGQNASLAWSDDQGGTWQPIALPSVEGPIPIVTSADGRIFVVMTPVPQISRDHGASWTPSRDLPQFARVISDRADPRRFYAVDFDNGVLLKSDDAGVSFNPVRGAGLPRDLRADRPRNQEVPVPLLAVPGRPGDLWLISSGRLFHSVDAGESFQAVVNDLSIARLSFGRAAVGHDYPALYAIASRGDLVAIWRSDDGGSTWNRINDAEHEYGRRFRCIAGDMRIDGRVYVGTDGRGIVYSDREP
jgi:photosystem II stability/assembly factor-like uncharacterized protein